MSLQSAVPHVNGADGNMDSFQALGLCEEAMHFDVEVTFPGAQPKIFDISTRDTVDKVKTIAHAHFCGNANLDEFLLGITEKEKLEIEFVKFILAHVRIREELESGELVRVGLFKKGVYTDAPAKEKIDLHTDINFAERRSSVSMGLSKLAVGAKRTSGSSPSISTSPSPILATKSPKAKSKGKDEPEVLIVYNSPPSLRERGSTLSNSLGRNSPPPVLMDMKRDKEKAHKRYHSESVVMEETPSTPPPPPPPLISPPKGVQSQSSLGLTKFVRNRRTLSVSTDSSPALLSLVEHPASQSSSSLLSSTPPQSPERWFSLPSFPPNFTLSYLYDPAVKGFVVESGSPKTQISSKELKITDTLKSEPWYSQYFFGREHANFIGSDEALGIFIVSVMQDTPGLLPSSSLSSSSDDADGNGEKKEGCVKVRAVVRTKKGDEKKTALMKNTGLFKSKKVSSKGMFQYICPFLSSNKITRIKNPDMCNSLKSFEERQLVKSYKFGVLYCKAGQTEEEQMFSNKDGSPDFEEFLDALGERITLKGWPNYRAGLDVKAGSTGLHSVYTKYNGFEVMYHVSTLLPHDSINMQQLERKRHIGNDIVVIVFKEGDQHYDPNCIKSEFNLVTKVKKANDPKTYYHVGFATKEGVPHFKPEIPTPAIFEKGDLFREFLLCKLINGENTSYEAPSFKIKIQRTRLALLKEIESKHPA